MKTNKSLVRNLTILSFTLAGISLAIMAYYFLYVNSRKEYLDQSNYRVLKRIGENIQGKSETFIQNRRSLYNAELEDLKKLLNEQDSLGNYTEVLTDSSFFKTEELRRKHSPLFYFYESDTMSEEKEKTLFEHQNVWHINYDKIAGIAGKEDSSADKKGTISEIMVSVRFDDLMDNLLRKDVYDELLIFQTGENGLPISTPDLIFSTFEGSFVPYEVKDSLYSFLDYQLDIEKRHIVNNVPYRIYAKPLTFHDSQLILCGLIKNEGFTKEAQYISAFGVLIITLIIAVLLLAFSPLRLAFISKNEQIRTSDILFNTISTILAASLATMLLLDWYSFQQLDRVRSISQLKDLSNQINQAFKEEICQAVAQLREYDQLDVEPSKEDYIYFGEYKKDPDAASKSVLTNILSTNSNLPAPNQYPNFNHIVWVDSLDQIQQEWTIKKEPEVFYQKGENQPLQPNVSVKGRKYIEKIKLGLAWNISDCGQIQGGDSIIRRGITSEDFALEAIRTRTKGENLAVISKRSDKYWENEQGEKQYAQIVFLTSYLYSVIRPVIPPGLGFCIIDEKGNVLFHSDPARNLQENFLEECRQPDLQAAIQTRTALNTQGQYLGVEHYLYLEPIGKLPLHLITFQNKTFYRSVHEQILSLTAIFILLSCLLSVIYIGLLIIFNPESYILKRNTFVLDWLRPNLHQGGKYRLLIINNLMTLFLAYVFTINTSMVASISIIIFSYIATFTSVFLTLNISRYKKFLLNDHGRIIFSVGLLLFFLNLFMFLFWDEETREVETGSEALKVLLFEILMVGNFLAMRLLLLVSKDFSAKSLGRVLRFFGDLIGVNSSYQGNSYIFFLFSWVIIISIFPTYKYYQIAYERESRIVVQHSQMTMAKRIEDRTNWIQQRYHLMNVDSNYVSYLSELGVFYAAFQTEKWEDDSVDIYPRNHEARFSGLERFLTYLRPRYDEWARITNQVYENNAIWSWEVEKALWPFIISPEELYFTYQKNSIPHVNLISRIPTFSFKNAVQGNENGHAFYLGLCIIGFCIILGIIYALIKFSVDKLFAQRILELPYPDAVALRTTLRQLRSQHLFLVIPPRVIQSDYMHILQYEENVLKGEAVRKVEYIHLADWMRNHAPTRNSLLDFLRSRSTSYDTIVLDHFEEAVEIADGGLTKYEILSELLEQDKQIVIISTLNPLDIEEIFTPLEKAEGDSIKSQAYHRNNIKWSELLSEFNKIYYPQEQWEIVQRPFEIKELIQKGHAFLQVPKIHMAELGSNGIPAENYYPLSVDILEGKYRLKVYNEVLAHVPVVLLDRNNPKLSLKEKLNEIVDLREEYENGPLLILSNMTPMDIYRQFSSYTISRPGPHVSYKRPKGEQGWRLLLSYFYKGMYLMDSARLQKEEEIENIIRLECLHGSYLQDIQYDLVNRLKQKLINPDEDRKNEKVILMIKSQAQLFYHSLWSSCTKDEKFLIHDMAYDGVFNADNVEVIQSLMRKGIFIKTVNGISLMNKSFQNFILSNVSLTNPVLEEKKSEQSGIWNSIRFPISLIVIALAGFLFFTQKEIIDQTLAFSAAVAAFVPTLRTIIDNLGLFKLGGRILKREKKSA